MEDSPDVGAEDSPRRPWWRRVLGWPARAWRLSREGADFMTRLWGVKRTGWRWWLARTVFFVFALILAPFEGPFRRYANARGAARVKKEARRLWAIDPYEATEIVRRVHQRARMASPKDGFPDRVDVPPYGRLNAGDLIELSLHLVNCEMALGRYEDAMEVCRTLPEIAETVNMQVDCLVAMHRRDEAIALLRQKLHLDVHGDQLHRKLAELLGVADITGN